jgi:hypothetical protein
MGSLTELADQSDIPEDLEKVYRHYLRREGPDEAVVA